MQNDIILDIKTSFINLEYDKTKKLVQEAIKRGIDPNTIIEKALRPAMDEIGKKFEEGEYFLAELIVAGELFKEIMEILEPEIKRRGGAKEKLGVVVIGTVRGDLHDIGKNVVATMLRAAGFEVHDLGVDVPPEDFVKKAKEVNADIIGMSALLTTTMIEMKNTIEALKAAGLRDKVKVIVGGAPVTEEFAKEIGADAYARDAVEAVEVCKKLIEEKKKAKD